MTEASAATAAEPESVEEVEARGYVGQADERDRDEYALTTGPDSPDTLQATLEAKRAEIDAQLEELAARAKARAESVKQRAGAARSNVQEHRASRQAKGD